MVEMECTEWALHDPPHRLVSVTKRREDREKKENFQVNTREHTRIAYETKELRTVNVSVMTVAHVPVGH